MSKRRTSFLLSSIVFVAVLLVITAILNLIVGQLPSSAVRVDMTQHKEYTLSDATRQIFSRLNDLITVTYYVSKELPGQFAPLRQDTVDFLNEGNRFFGNELYAALRLGDPDYMEADLAWVRNMLSARQISPARLNPYLTAYRDALNEVIGSRSAAITNWLDARLSGFDSSEY